MNELSTILKQELIGSGADLVGFDNLSEKYFDNGENYIPSRWTDAV